MSKAGAVKEKKEQHGLPTAFIGLDAPLKHKALRLASLLDRDFRARLEILANLRCIRINEAMIHARSILQEQAGIPIVDALTIDRDGNTIDTFSIPLLPVVPDEESKRFLHQ